MPADTNLDNKVELEVGDTAPNFSASIQYPDKLEQFDFYKTLDSGKKVLLVFYPSDDTPGCTAQLCGLRDTYQGYAQENVEVVGVNHGSSSSHLKFIQKFSFPFGIVIDQDKSIRDSYGATKLFFKNVTTKRGVFLVDTDRKILFKHWGQQDNQKILEFLKSKK